MFDIHCYTNRIQIYCLALAIVITNEYCHQLQLAGRCAFIIKSLGALHIRNVVPTTAAATALCKPEVLHQKLDGRLEKN